MTTILLDGAMGTQLQSRGLKPGESVIKVEVGSGWPLEIPKDKRREDLFK